MNWLAHLQLSPPTPQDRLGNLLPDLLGLRDQQTADSCFQPGIRMHKAVDHFTDKHPVVKRSLSRYSERWRRLASVLTDLYYDHYLSIHWDLFHPNQRRTDFIKEVYPQLLAERSKCPTAAHDVLQRMTEQDWLGSYATIHGMEIRLHCVAARLRRPQPLHEAIAELKNNYASLEADFLEFYPQLQAFTKARTMLTFESLTNAHQAWLKHGFSLRYPGQSFSTDRHEAIEQLIPLHEALIRELGFTEASWWTAEQIHGAGIARVGQAQDTEQVPARTIPAVDGLLTNTPGTLLGIYVADCGPVYLVDPVCKAIGLLHSGKKGTDANITGRAIAQMKAEFGSKPENILLQLGPCIRPPAYDTDFSKQILASALEAGLRPENIHDCEICTSKDLLRFYSYRTERGATGRHLALLGIANASPTETSPQPKT